VTGGGWSPRHELPPLAVKCHTFDSVGMGWKVPVMLSSVPFLHFRLYHFPASSLYSSLVAPFMPQHLHIHHLILH
jgi:hypothetical protein